MANLLRCRNQDRVRTRPSTARHVRSFASRIGSWLRRIVRREQLADPQWDEERRREQSGKMGEDIRTEEEPRSTSR
jgi:hypothetical protein